MNLFVDLGADRVKQPPLGHSIEVLERILQRDNFD